MKLNEHIHYAQVPLLGDVPIRTFIVKGSDYSVLIDSGISSMFPEIVAALEDSGAHGNLKILINTHSHHDHIGCNNQVKRKYNPLIFAPKTYLAWHENFETHISEFARSFPDIFPETAELRSEVLGPLDKETKVDAAYGDGLELRPGDGVVLKAYLFPGHMKEELGFVETKTKTLLVGDAVTLLEAPLFHGHLDVAGYRRTIERLRTIVVEQNISTILTAHFPIMEPESFFKLLDQAKRYIDGIEQAISSIVDRTPKSLEQIWHSICDRFGKIHEFRSLSMVAAHLDDLRMRGMINHDDYLNVRRA